MPKIAVIGAQGHLGSRLCERLASVQPEAAILPTKDKDSTVEIASQGDIVAIAVRTDQMREALAQISTRLKQHATVVSFVGRYPLAEIIAATKHSAIRVMADPFWNVGAYYKSNDVDAEVMGIVARLAITEPVEVHSDADIDRYTNLLAHLLAVLLLQRLDRVENAPIHLAFLAQEFSNFGRVFTTEEFETYELGNDAEESLRAIATPGGITEKAVDLLETDASPEQIQESLLNL